MLAMKLGGLESGLFFYMVPVLSSAFSRVSCRNGFLETGD